MCLKGFPLWFHKVPQGSTRFHKVPQEQWEICSPTAAGLHWLPISEGLQLNFVVRNTFMIDKVRALLYFGSHLPQFLGIPPQK